MDIQRYLDTMSASWRQVRSRYHLTLGGAIKALEALEPTMMLQTSEGGGVGDVASYRGYYSDLAFEPAAAPTTVGVVLDDLRKALGAEFMGYKGGDFLMGADTPLWVSPFGCSGGPAVVGIEAKDGVAILQTKVLEDD